MPNDVGDESITTETKNEFVKNICENTTKQKRWMRNCPICNKEIFHTERWVRNKFQKINKKCKSCGAYNKGKSLSLLTKQKLRISQTGKIASIETRQKMSVSQSKRKHPESVKLKMRGSGNGMYGVHRYDTKNPFYGKRHSEISRLKMRLASIQRLARQGVTRSYNPKACQKINEYGNQFGYKFQHAMNGGEVELYGYFVDGYDKENNIVFEYDEPRHYVYGKLKIRDFVRMTEIKTHVGCRFLRFNEYTNEVTEF
jgi:hypothetical protein